MLRIEITNDRSGEGNIANYRYRAFVNDKEIANGKIVNHDRSTGFHGIVKDMVRQFNCDQNKPINVIWTITTMKHLSDARKVGWYYLKEDAIESVESNELDINEGLTNPYAVIRQEEQGKHPYAVVEGVGQGVYPTSFEQIWFKWEGSEREGKYVRIDKVPEEFESIVNYNFG